MKYLKTYEDYHFITTKCGIVIEKDMFIILFGKDLRSDYVVEYSHTPNLDRLKITTKEISSFWGYDNKLFMFSNWRGMIDYLLDHEIEVLKMLSDDIIEIVSSASVYMVDKSTNFKAVKKHIMKLYNILEDKWIKEEIIVRMESSKFNF